MAIENENIQPDVGMSSYFISSPYRNKWYDNILITCISTAVNLQLVYFLPRRC